MTLRVSVAGVAVWGPGLEGWEVARAVLRGAAPLSASERPVPAPSLLPANERRRCGEAVRLALEVAQGACAVAGLPPAGLRCVFGSANGDGAVVHALLETLAGAEMPPPVSPTLFHNSVHNAAAGYWTIATGAQDAATCLGCHDATFAAALLKAAAEVGAEQRPVLLCLYDAPLPPPLAVYQPGACRFAAAFVLTPGEAGPIAVLDLAYAPTPAAASALLPRQPALRELALRNPAARALRLLEAIACGQPDALAGEYIDGHLAITVRPCSTAAAS